MSKQPLLQIENLTKSYDNKKVVDNVSFAINKGECLGLLGPNGAGKSTTIEIIENITAADSGKIWYKGKAIGAQFKKESGIQFQNTALMDFLSVKDQLLFFASLFPDSVAIEQLIDYCQLSKFIDRDVSKLSGGQRQRVLLAIALINNPEIVFLDEPTTGLDPQSRSRFWDLIQKLKADGKSIVLTTHYMDEAESLSDNLILLDQGKIIAQGSPAELLEQHFEHTIVSIAADKWQQHLKISSKTTLLRDKVVVQSTSVTQTIAELIEFGQPLESLQVRKPTLEDLFLKLTGKELRE